MKMANYRSKLKRQNVPCPELHINSLKRKGPAWSSSGRQTPNNSAVENQAGSLDRKINGLQVQWKAVDARVEAIKEEFRRITTIPLEQTFMHKLDEYTPKLITLMKAKGGAVGNKMRPHLDRLSQKQRIEMRRETVIRSLILYLGEKEEELFEDCLEDSRSDVSSHILKILIVHGADEEPVHVSIVVEGNEGFCQGAAIPQKLAHCSWD
ncbi:hypothetical protein D5F01_LYC02280 [Larimichthys crocea]|uniref:Uncharacterized protein n=1 Tax=Larimichthys crocea TaxID=215358 RepID=A0A6G0J8S3_LARCR|nr:hypothetical protein D5F01_LYC02280 [Larimichthys crocea]